MSLLTKFGSIPSQGGELWLSGWSYGKKITIPEAKVDAELTNFPLTVYLNNTNFDFSKAKADGSDIRFTDKNMNQLTFERKEHGLVTLNTYTTDLCTGGTAISGGDNASYPASNAFANNVNWRWFSLQLGASVIGNAYIGYHFITPQNIRKITYIPRNDSNYNLSSMLLQYSDNGTSWVTASTISLTKTTYSLQTFTNSDYGSHSYWRLLANSSVTTGYAWGLNEIEMMGVESGIYSATYNVQVPTISATTNTEVYLWYGNASATDTANTTGDVWDDNYVMVQHMGDSLIDATGNGNNGTATGTTVVNTDYGKARSFNGSSYISIADSVAWNFGSGDFCYEFCFEPSTVGDHKIMYQGTTSATAIQLFLNNSTGVLTLASNLTGFPTMTVTSATLTGLFGMKQFEISRIGNNGYIFADGVLLKTTDITGKYYSDVNQPLLIGGFNFVEGGTWYYATGKFGEIRITKGLARSDAWIKAESLALKNNLFTIENIAEKLADIEVTVATTSINITGLNLGNGDEVMLVCDVLNTAGDMMLYANNNTTNSNYWCQALIANSTTVAGYRYNFPYMRMTAGNFFHNIKIKLTNSGYFITQSESSELKAPSTIRLDNTYTTSTFTSTSITQLTITCSTASGILAGSRFQLYRIGRGI